MRRSTLFSSIRDGVVTEGNDWAGDNGRARGRDEERFAPPEQSLNPGRQEMIATEGGKRGGSGRLERGHALAQVAWRKLRCRVVV